MWITFNPQEAPKNPAVSRCINLLKIHVTGQQYLNVLPFLLLKFFFHHPPVFAVPVFR
jgi:hypothetical protein